MVGTKGYKRSATKSRPPDEYEVAPTTTDKMNADQEYSSILSAEKERLRIEKERLELKENTCNTLQAISNSMLQIIGKI